MHRSSLYIRNIIFGVEDGLVSTVGLLSGIALGSVSRPIILLTGIVYIFVEAFSMAVGSFLSEESVEEYENGKAAKASMSPAAGAFAIFVSSVAAGLIPILPYMTLFGWSALIVSIAVSLLALVILGYASALIIKVRPWRRAMRMVTLGGSAIIIGALVSLFVRGV